MTKKHAFLVCSVAVMMIVVLNSSTAGANGSPDITSNEKGVVAKTPGQEFTVSITVQNTGKDEGSWTINVVFEGTTWSWKGTQKAITLEQSEKETLIWKGNVPQNAEKDSIARLVVYYGDTFEALDWWLLVTATSELTIKDSCVE